MTENSFQVFINSVHNKIIYVIVLVPYHQVLHQTTPHKYSTHSYLLLNNCRFYIFNTCSLAVLAWDSISTNRSQCSSHPPVSPHGSLHLHGCITTCFKILFIKYTMSQKHWKFYSTNRWKRTHGFLSRHHFRITFFLLWYHCTCTHPGLWSVRVIPFGANQSPLSWLMQHLFKQQSGVEPRAQPLFPSFSRGKKKTWHDITKKII